MPAIPPPDYEELTIRTGGQTLGGWVTERVTRGIELLPSFGLVELTEKYQGQIAEAAVTPFSTAEVYLGVDKVLTGYVDVYQPEYDARSHKVAIAVRSKTEDVVDCSVDVDALTASQASWEIRAATIGAALKKVVQPLGIGVVLPDGDKPLDVRYPFVIVPGMTVYQIVEEMARTVEMLVWDDASGNLVLSGAGTKRAGSAIVEGQNVEVGWARLSGDQRYYKYVVFAQATVTDATGPHLPLRAQAIDSDVPRKSRLLMIVTDIPGPDQKYVQQRADWECARRYGRSRQVRATVTGWRDGKGALWQPNTIVNVQAPSLKMNEDLLVWQCTWLRGENGTQTILDLMPRAGAIPAPFQPKPPITLDPNLPRGQ